MLEWVKIPPLMSGGHPADMGCMALATQTTTEVFPWNQSYSVGIEQIDTQHKVLIRLINELHASMAAGHGNQALGKILDELVRYTEVHFTFEENLLRAKGYAKLAAHHDVHRKLIGEVAELRNKHRANKLTLTLEVMKFLKGWLGDHIMVHDQAYARGIKK